MFDFLSKYIIATPDFGHSDIWHFNFALKFLLAKTLKAGYLPLWSKDIGSGFPLLGEGQIGMLNIYNFLAFRFLNPILAFNLGFIVIILTTLSGTYLFSRKIKLTKIASLFSAIVFSLSGVFVTQVVHYNLIQAASFLPWEFFLAESFLQKKMWRYLLALSLIISQQILSGFQQLTMISILSLSIYLLLRCRQERTIQPLIQIFAAISIGTVLGLPQLLSSWQLVHLSNRSGGLSLEVLSNFPFLPVNLLGFINPYIFGDPRIGTYPRFSQDWGIFWESTGYIGILPLILILSELLKKQFKKYHKPFLALLALTLILLLGKSTPLFFLFQIPPLSLFRVPARFLFPFVWSLSILAGLALSNLPKQLAALLLIIALIDVSHFAITYHAVVNANDWLKTPETVQVISLDKSWFRIYPVNPYADWNTRFLTVDPKDKLFHKGWKNMGSYYRFRNSLDPNQNLYWNISSADYYTGTGYTRIDLFKRLLSQGIVGNPERSSLLISSPSAKLLSLTGAKYLISPYQLDKSESDSRHISYVQVTQGDPKFYIYQNNLAKPHAYLTNSFVVAESILDLQKKLSDPTNSDAVLESAPNIEKDDQPKEATVVRNEDLQVIIKTKSPVKSLLILSDSYYPGWQAKIDGTVTKILPANLNQRALIVPAGSHTVQFDYQPSKGLLDSLPSFL